MLDFDATETPADVVAALSLGQGVRYTCQNLSTVATLFVREQATQPPVTARAFRIESGGNFTLKPEGDPIWAWTDNHTCPLILSEAP